MTKEVSISWNTPIKNKAHSHNFNATYRKKYIKKSSSSIKTLYDISKVSRKMHFDNVDHTITGTNDLLLANPFVANNASPISRKLEFLR